MKIIDENTSLEYRWLNMDNRCYSTEQDLLEYARTFKGGEQRCVSTGMLTGKPILMAYGTRPFTYEDMEALDARLSPRRDQRT